jgi:hypothetical protein
MTHIVTVHCVRDSDCNSKDDIIRITKTNSSYTITHTVPKSENTLNKSLTRTIEVDLNGLGVYMNTFIELLYLDNDPFEVVQFDFLCMPSVVLTPKNMKETKKYILKYIYKLSHLGASDKVTPKPEVYNSEPLSPIPLSSNPLSYNSLSSLLDNYEDIGITYYS